MVEPTIATIALPSGINKRQVLRIAGGQKSLFDSLGEGFGMPRADEPAAGNGLAAADQFNGFLSRAEL